MLNKQLIKSSFESIQDEICRALETIDGGVFAEDIWHRPGGGGGRTRILNGNIIEKGGVNFSAVEGELPESLCKAMELEPCEFFATGVSIVMHPKNPWVPIIHMNIRYFETSTGKWWFGGGIDLTPHYVNPEQTSYFHKVLKSVCDRHHPDYYSKFKSWADDYFYIEHRKETRGIGGIFFDNLGKDNLINKEKAFAFVSDVGNTFAPLYVELINRNKNIIYSEANTEWQQIRRGRYVEFNLVYDRGTKFGLRTEGRIESILMSLPTLARWEYDYKTKPASLEEMTLDYLKKDIDWVNID
jgi:coproporphyrinogen III oxidase